MDFFRTAQAQLLSKSEGALLKVTFDGRDLVFARALLLAEIAWAEMAYSEPCNTDMRVATNSL